MRKFIIKTVLLLSPLLILAIPLEYLLRQIPNDYAYKKNYLDNHSKEIQTLILGSSLTHFGINPDYFSKNAFNASHLAQSLDFDLAIINKYQNNLDNLNIIVLPVSYSNLFSKLEDKTNAERIKNYRIYYGIKGNPLSEYSELLSVKLRANFGRLYYHYIKHKDYITCTERGWGKTYKSEWAKDLQETGLTAAKIQNRDIENHPNAFVENLKILDSFSEFCNQRNINLIFITTPAYCTYRENISAERIAKMVETINDFVNTHSNCYYLNWFEDTDFVAGDFYDANHLDEIGAEKLSTKLSQYIDREIYQ